MTSLAQKKAFISDKPYPIPIEMRPLWRIGLIICAIVVTAKDKRYLDLKKTNILVWMLIRRQCWPEYEAFLSGRERDVPLVSVDTATYKAVEFAIAKGFLRLESGRLHLTDSADEIYSILSEHEIMHDEIAFLIENGRRLTEQKTRELTGGLL